MAFCTEEDDFPEGTELRAAQDVSEGGRGRNTRALFVSLISLGHFCPEKW